jgi:Fur family ferric uptake transcriptional regulator
MDSPAQVLQRVRDEARRRNVRWTNQRQAIVETFVACDDHLTVEELHRRVRLSDPSVSAATVYRTINMLTEIGVALKRQFGSGSAVFERSFGKDHHDHLVCTACGAITEFHHEIIEKLQEEVAGKHSFQLVSHRLELYGTCAACVAKSRLETGVSPDFHIAPR